MTRDAQEAIKSGGCQGCGYHGSGHYSIRRRLKLLPFPHFKKQKWCRKCEYAFLRHDFSRLVRRHL